jgi:hypothetical protein
VSLASKRRRRYPPSSVRGLERSTRHSKEGLPSGARPQTSLWATLPPNNIGIPRPREEIWRMSSSASVNAWERVEDMQPQAPASGPLESELVTEIRLLWCEVLTRPDIKPDDQFFAIGGTSLSALRAMSSLSRQVGRKLPVRLLFENQTAATLGVAISELLHTMPDGGVAPDVQRDARGTT